MIGALHFTDEIDLTGIATALLALATAGLALWTRRAVNQGTTEVERAHRPVLMPIIDTLQDFPDWAPRGSTVLQDVHLSLAPQYIGLHDAFYVPIRNVGMGPALHVKATVELGDSTGHSSASGIESTMRSTWQRWRTESPSTCSAFSSRPSAA